MAIYKATASGNWSTMTWSPAGTPGAGDTVYANGFTIDIDQNISVLELTNKAGTGISANGFFRLNTADATTVITANIVNGQTIAANQVLQLTQANQHLTINGNLSTISTYTASDSAIVWASTPSNGSTIIINGYIDCSAISTNADYGVYLGGAGHTLIVTGAYIKPSMGNSNCYAIYSNSVNSIVNVVADVYGGAGGSSTTCAIRTVVGTVIVNIVGNMYPGQGTIIYGTAGVIVNITGTGYACATGNIAGGIQMAVAFTINHTGDCYGGNGQYFYYITSNGTVVLNLYGSAIANVGGAVRIATTATNAIVYVQKAIGAQDSGSIATVACINETTSAIFTVGEIEFGAYGQSPTSGRIRFKNAYITQANVLLEDGVTRRVISAAGADDADEADVRLGVVYAFGTKTGTLAVPPKPMVALGVPTDDGLGTLNPSIDVSTLAADLFDVIKSSSDPLAARWRDVSTVQSVNQQLGSL